MDRDCRVPAWASVRSSRVGSPRYRAEPFSVQAHGVSSTGQENGLRSTPALQHSSTQSPSPSTTILASRDTFGRVSVSAGLVTLQTSARLAFIRILSIEVPPLISLSSVSGQELRCPRLVVRLIRESRCATALGIRGRWKICLPTPRGPSEPTTARLWLGPLKSPVRDLGGTEAVRLDGLLQIVHPLNLA